MFFGTGPQNTVYSKNMTSKGLAGTDFELVTADGVIPVHVPVPGRHMVTNALAAAAVGRDLGLSLEEIANRMETYMNPRSCGDSPGTVMKGLFSCRRKAVIPCQPFTETWLVIQWRLKEQKRAVLP